MISPKLISGRSTTAAENLPGPLKRALTTKLIQAVASLPTNYTRTTTPQSLVRARMVYYALVGEFTIGTRSNQTERLAEIRLQHAILTKRS